MSKLGRYQDDEQGQYNFSFSDSDGKHISVSFRAEPDYDLDIIFQEFQNFLVASGHDVEGPIGELTFEEDDSDDEDYMRSWDADSDEVHAMTQAQAADKFSMENFPNNGWPFGELTSAALPSLTTADFPGLKVTDISSLYSQSHSEWIGLGDAPTMAPLTQEQIDLWKTPMPGTLGGAKIDFK